MIITKKTAYEFAEGLEQVGTNCGVYDVSNSFFALFGYNVGFIKSATVGGIRVSVDGAIVSRSRNTIALDVPKKLCGRRLVLILEIDWKFIMAQIQYLLKVASSAVQSLGVPAAQLANGVLTEFTLPSVVPVNYEAGATASIKGVVFSSVSDVDFAAAQANDKVFRFAANTTGAPTLTFKYAPCDITSANSPGSAEAYVDDATGVLVPQIVYVQYTE